MPVITLRLISGDVELYKSCREIIAVQAGGTWRIVTGLPAAESDEDLYIWDYSDTFVFPESIHHDPAKHMFLVDRRSAARVREQAPFSDVLLKPVTRATLTAFLGLPLRAHGRSHVR
ncbi:MAG TPA: hypothetical protein VNY05_45895 [Candidatus Acidoferrales bacterium]|nr:hypothetical protein [Candidatus Acidoferrales bacterium]